MRRLWPVVNRAIFAMALYNAGCVGDPTGPDVVPAPDLLRGTEPPPPPIGGISYDPFGGGQSNFPVCGPSLPYLAEGLAFSYLRNAQDNLVILTIRAAEGAEGVRVSPNARIMSVNGKVRGTGILTLPVLSLGPAGGEVLVDLSDEISGSLLPGALSPSEPDLVLYVPGLWTPVGAEPCGTTVAITVVFDEEES